MWFNSFRFSLLGLFEINGLCRQSDNLALKLNIECCNESLQYVAQLLNEKYTRSGNLDLHLKLTHAQLLHIWEFDKFDHLYITSMYLDCVLKVLKNSLSIISHIEFYRSNELIPQPPILYYLLKLYIQEGNTAETGSDLLWNIVIMPKTWLFFRTGQFQNYVNWREDC